MSQPNEFCRHNPLCCFSTSVYCCCCLFHYRLSPETFGYTLAHTNLSQLHNKTTELSVIVIYMCLLGKHLYGITNSGNWLCKVKWNISGQILGNCMLHLN